MTTIVYDHSTQQIAIDGRTRSGTLINTEDAVKWIKRDSQIWFLCGSVSDRERFIDYMNHGSPDAPKWQIECSAFVVEGGKVYHCVICDEGDPCKSEIQYSDAMGSGGSFALAAIDFGKTAADAIKYAAKRDSGTGGRIAIYDIASGDFSYDHC